MGFKFNNSLASSSEDDSTLVPFLLLTGTSVWCTSGESYHIWVQVEIVDVDSKILVAPLNIVESLIPLNVVVLVSSLEVFQILMMVILLVIIPEFCAW